MEENKKKKKENIKKKKKQIYQIMKIKENILELLGQEKLIRFKIRGL